MRVITISAAALALSLLVQGCGGSGSGTLSVIGFTASNLTADTSGIASQTDTNLVNPWGISFSPSGPFWVSDNGTGLSTVYDGTGHSQGLVVTIPAAGSAANGPVTGQVYNGTTDFQVSGTPANFIFVNEDGVVSAWTSGTTAVTEADRSATGAVYKGLAMGSSGGANFLYATNFNSGMVDVFDHAFAYHTSFTDPGVPAGFAPFGIANFNGLLYVTFAKQNGAKHDDVAGVGNGYVDIFKTDGTLVKRLVSQGTLNSPWGLALAPSGFGHLGGTLLVGNFGDGAIHAYDVNLGTDFGALKTASGAAITEPGLWGLTFGNGAGAGLTTTLYFTAGPGGESHGLFGAISGGS